MIDRYAAERTGSVSMKIKPIMYGVGVLTKAG